MSDISKVMKMIKDNLILVDTWNKVRVDKEKFIGYVENFK